MTLQLTGKNIKLGDALRDHFQTRIENLLTKYLGRIFPAHVSVEKINSSFNTHISVQLWSGLTLQATGHGHDGYASADDALEHLETRLRRYKGRLKDHHSKHSHKTDPEQAIQLAAAYTLAPEPADVDDDIKMNGAPAIVAESTLPIRIMAVSDAVMQMDLANQEFILFRNAGSGHINLVYRRDDGNIGWVDTAEKAS